jgi:dTDP-4-dehydrorhamnose reductase
MDKTYHPKLLILGVSGFLGSFLEKSLSKNFNIYGTVYKSEEKVTQSRVKLDGTSGIQIIEVLLSFRPDIVINCAGFTSVDQCELDPLKANLLNFQMPVNVSNACNELGIRFVQISTDHFENQNVYPYAETDASIPVNIYGLTKRRAEEYLVQNSVNTLLVRTNFFGLNSVVSHSLLDTVLSQLKAGRNMNGFYDIRFTPVALHELARTLTVLINAGGTGLIHVSGNESISKYEFLRMIARQFGYSENLIRGVSISENTQLVRRPKNMCLSNELLRSDYNIEIESVSQSLMKLRT